MQGLRREDRGILDDTGVAPKGVADSCTELQNVHIADMATGIGIVRPPRTQLTRLTDIEVGSMCSCFVIMRMQSDGEEGAYYASPLLELLFPDRNPITYTSLSPFV